MKDKVILGVITGLLANIVKLSFNYLAFRLDFASLTFWQIAASWNLGKEELVKPTALLVGAIIDLTVASIIGVVFIYFLYFVGRDYILGKGIVYGLTIWVFLFGTLQYLNQTKLPLNISDIIVTAIAHSIYGLVLAIIAKNFDRFPTYPV